MPKDSGSRKAQFRLQADAGLCFPCLVSEPSNAAPDTPASIWDELDRAAGEIDHPWRTPALATADGSVRTIVLRGVSASRRELVFHTDARSPKIAQLTAGPEVEWLFYNPANGVQVRARARASIDSRNETAEAAWLNVPPANRLNYSSPQPPGTPLPVEGMEASPAPDHADKAYANFAVVTTQVVSIDWLLLAPAGNRRCLFDFNPADAGWNTTPLVP